MEDPNTCHKGKHSSSQTKAGLPGSPGTADWSRAGGPCCKLTSLGMGPLGHQDPTCTSIRWHVVGLGEGDGSHSPAQRGLRAAHPHQMVRDSKCCFPVVLGKQCSHPAPALTGKRRNVGELEQEQPKGFPQRMDPMERFLQTPKSKRSSLHQIIRHD